MNIVNFQYEINSFIVNLVNKLFKGLQFLILFSRKEISCKGLFGITLSLWYILINELLSDNLLEFVGLAVETFNKA